MVMENIKIRKNQFQKLGKSVGDVRNQSFKIQLYVFEKR